MTEPVRKQQSEASREGLVWDLPVRLAHWGLVVCLGGSWLTAEFGVEYREYHFWCGYAALAIVLFRLAWGIVGTRFARFGQFLPRPAQVVRYTRAQFTQQGRPADPLGPGHNPLGAGHNPLGALSVVVMLGLIAVQIGTGLFTDDDILYTGPYQPAVSAATAEWLTDLHHANFDYLLVMVGLHLVAIAYYQFVRGQGLTRAMLTGRKPLVAFGDQSPLSVGVQRQVWIRALCVAVTAVALVVALVYLAPEPIYDDYYY